MKTVKFIKSHPKYGYFAGDETTLSIKAADELIGSKHVQEVKVKAEPKVVVTEPVIAKASHHPAKKGAKK